MVIIIDFGAGKLHGFRALAKCVTLIYILLMILSNRPCVEVDIAGNLCL